jgi:hypothetical protein
MKRIIFLALCVLAAAAAVSAQTGNRPVPDAGRGFTPPAQETISGNLGISGGMISLESGGGLYYVAGLNRFIGFIDGLKEGAAVSLTGYAFDSPRLSGAKVFRAIELRLNGKSYELAPPAGEFRRMENGPRAWGGFPRGGDFRSRNGSGSWDRGPGHHRRGSNGPDRRGPGRRN